MRPLGLTLPSIQRTMPSVSLSDPSIGPTDHALGFPPPFSARKRPPPSVPLVGGGQSLATGKFRSRSPEQSERGAGDRDRTLSRSCPAQKSKNFVSKARSRSAALRGSFRLVQKGRCAGLHSASAATLAASTRKADRRPTPATRATGLRRPPRKTETQEQPAETGCRRCRSVGWFLEWPWSRCRCRHRPNRATARRR